MRVPVKQRASRSSPASAAASRAKNKRRVSSDGPPPAKTKKRKLPTQLAVDVPPDVVTGQAAGSAAGAAKRKPNKKAAAGKKAVVVVDPSPVKVPVVKKQKVKKMDVKLTAGKGKVIGKKVSSVVVAAAASVEKKTGCVKVAKKLQSRKLSAADVDMDGVKDVQPSGEKGTTTTTTTTTMVEQLAAVAPPKKATKKAAAKVVAVVADVKAKTPKVKTPIDAAVRKSAVKLEKKIAVKKAVATGVKLEKAADVGGKKTRRRKTASSVGELPTEPSASLFANSSFDVIDDVARNLARGGCASTLKKTKESDEKTVKVKEEVKEEEGSSAIRNKVVAGGKNKKQLTKKTPKSVDVAVAALKKVEPRVENEISDVGPATINEAGAEKPENNLLPDKDLLDKEIKSKIVIKKTLKEKKPQVNTIKKKVMFKKTSSPNAKVGCGTTTLKAAKVTFKVKQQQQSEPRKRSPAKKGKKSLEGQQVASGSSFQDDYNSSTSDDCTLDLLLRRQKQLKQEELNSTKSVAVVDVKPIIKVDASATPCTVSASTKSKIKIKIESKNAEVNATPTKRHVVKKGFVHKGKAKPVIVKKPTPTALKKLKLATAVRKKAIVQSKVKRMRSNEVSKLGSGSESEQRARRMKLFGFWSGPKRHRVASLNALAKVHCLYENESRGALMSVCAKPPSPTVDEVSAGEEKPEVVATEVNTRTLRSGPGRRGIGQHWDQQTTSSSSSSEDNGASDSSSTPAALSLQPSYKQKLLTAKAAAKPVKKVSKPRRHEAVMDLKDMVVRKRMASLNASAILSASYSPIEKLQKKQRSIKDDDSPQQDVDDEAHVRKKKCKKKILLSKKLIDGDLQSDDDERNIIELATANNKKVATVIVNQDTDVTITGVYVNSTTHRSSTTHEGYCSIAGMQYLISSTSHTKTEARAVATETLLHAPAELVPPRVPSAAHPPGPGTGPAPAPLLQQPMKSYTPLGALSNMQPPGGPLSPLARRHAGCASAFSAPPPPAPTSASAQQPPPPHHHRHHAPTATGQGPPEQQPAPYMHGYYQPAGPLISAHHHHSLPKSSASALPTLEASPTSTPPTNAPSAPPPVSASTSSGTRGGDESSDNDVVITASSCHNPAGYNPGGAPSQSAPTYRYQSYPLPPAPQHHQYGYPSQYPAPQYYPVGGGQGGGYAPPPPPPHYHNPELCYTTPSYPPAPQYYHKSYSTPPPVSYPRRYGPPHPSQYYPPELYSQPPEQPGSRQMVATASTSYQQPPSADPYPQPPAPAPPVVPMVDSYPPPPAPYYPGYPPPAPPPCYSHSPPARSLAYIDTAYQGCPCPMQSCPKNVLTGPLTGEGKGPDPSAAFIHHLPLPPVALALPSEPPHAGGPPSPARGSAGMHPTPSPRLATAQGSDVTPSSASSSFRGKREPSSFASQITSESRAVGRDRNVGLLTIHKPQPSEPLTVLEKPTAVLRKAAGAAARAGTVNVGNDQTLTYGCGFKQQLQPLDFTKVDPKVEKKVKTESGNVESAASSPAEVGGNARKRKMKAECSAAPKPKKRNVAAATAPKRLAAKSKQSLQGDLVKDLENSKTPSLKAKCKNQPLSSANSCSLHNSKQNAKKRKLSNVEVLAENQEPTVAAKTKAVVAKAKSKEPKPTRPRLCPPSQEPVKARSVKVSKKSVGISEQLIEPPVCDLTATTLCSNGIVVSSTSSLPPTKPAAKSAARIVTKTTPIRRKLTKCQLNKIQQQGMNNIDDTIVEVVKMAVKKKLAPKSKLGKPQNVSCVLAAEAAVGKVNGRRKTDSDVLKVSHMLRSHGIQDGWESLAPAVPSPAPAAKCKVVAAKKATVKSVAAVVPSADVDVCPVPVLKKGNFLKPKWSNGWCWEGDAFQAKVHLNSEGTSVERICYPSMRHSEGDIIRPLDCILLKSGARRVDLPFVAKVAQLWENPDDGEMMVSLLWYYRPEHTDQGRRGDDMRDEIFASKHKDTNSVACIEDKCYVLTFNEYCRYRAGSRRQQEGSRDMSAVVPFSSEYPRASRQPTSSVSPDMVFFCRRVYDFRQKRILKNPC